MSYKPDLWTFRREQIEKRYKAFCMRLRVQDPWMALRICTLEVDYRLKRSAIAFGKTMEIR